MLELKAILIRVQTSCKWKNYKHIRVMSDNITAVSYVDNEGEMKSEFAEELWVWCTLQNMWVSAAQIRGTQNTEADNFSRSFSEITEWKLSTHLFQKISSMFGNPTLDVFASRINYEIDRYISWKPVLKALAIDAFSIKCNTEFYHIFPIFSLLGKVTAKTCRDKKSTQKVHPKSSPTTPKALPTSTRVRLTTQDIINASLRKLTCQKHLYYQTRSKECCAEKNIAYDSPTVEQLLNFFF